MLTIRHNHYTYIHLRIDGRLALIAEPLFNRQWSFLQLHPKLKMFQQQEGLQ